MINRLTKGPEISTTAREIPAIIRVDEKSRTYPDGSVSFDGHSNGEAHYNLLIENCRIYKYQPAAHAATLVGRANVQRTHLFEGGDVAPGFALINGKLVTGYLCKSVEGGFYFDWDERGLARHA